MPIDLEDLERLANDRPFHTVDIALASAVPALIAEVRRLRAELELLRVSTCEDCNGNGRVWVGEDEDRPVTCYRCRGTGRQRL